MLITNVSVRTAPFSNSTWLDGQRISTPMSRFSEHSERRSSWRGPGSELVWVHIETDEGEWGIGQSRGGAVTASLIEHHFTQLLVGNDPGEVIRLAEMLRLAALPYASGGTSAMAVSACELALWDLTARRAGLPLFSLLGGRAGPLPYSITVPHASLVGQLDAGFVANAVTIKIPMTYGPIDGRRHLRDNVATVESVRSRIPDHIGISVDCFMSWSISYAADFAQATKELGLDWIEEPLMPDDTGGYSELRRRLCGTRVAGGEHIFSLRDGVRFIESGCIDVFQLDVTWGGGLTVAATLGTLAAERNITFAPHASALQPWALHLLAAQPAGALAEVLVGLDGAASVPAPSMTPGVGIDPASVGFT